jgi:hypothetical protein
VRLKAMPTSLNYDVEYLKRLVDNIVEHFEPGTLQEAVWLADLRWDLSLHF